MIATVGVGMTFSFTGTWTESEQHPIDFVTKDDKDWFGKWNFFIDMTSLLIFFGAFLKSLRQMLRIQDYLDKT